MKTKIKIIGISICFVVLTSVILANQNSPSQSEPEGWGFKIVFDECTGCGGCLESGITCIVPCAGYNHDVAMWTSTYTILENNAIDYILGDAPIEELFMAYEAKASCPSGAIY